MTAASSAGARRPPAGSHEPAGGQRECLELRGVTKRFGGMIAVDRLDLSVEPGEFLTLLGPSGCGKSTALNCIAGLMRLSEGEIHFGGKRVDRMPPEKRGFGMVFQNYALFPHLTARENVAFGLEVRGLRREEVVRRTSEALAVVRLEAHGDKHPGQLSGGQQQRVAIARALVVEPRLLLMDEPLSNLDTKLRGELRTEIKRLHQRLGLTSVYVTHDQGEALSLSDRVVVLRDGRVQQIGAANEVYEMPATAFVADFMGYRNLLRAEVESVDGHSAVVDAGGLELRGTAMGDLAPRGRAIAAIRPHDVLCHFAAGDGLRGRVEVVEYEGNVFVADILLASGLRLYAESADPLAPGDEIGIHIDPRRLLVFPDQDAPQA